MRIMMTAAAMVMAAGLYVSADLKDITGNWIGQVVTASRGDMDIALELRMEKEKLTGAVKTGHGSWPVSNVTDDAGVFTVTFQTDEGPGTMSGRIEGGRFSGQWRNPMASGTFDLARSKKP